MHISRDLRRKFVQFIAAVLTNRELTNLYSGGIYKGSEKNFCAPGLNCYSCPAATFSCPIGALQAVGGTAGYGFSFYVSGFLLLLGVVWGRLVCGFLCPFGLLQELLHKLPGPKKRFFRPLRFIKYGILLVFVLLLPVITLHYGDTGIGLPAFCQYICPAGTLEAAIPLLITHPEFRQATGALFAWKAAILIVVVLGCVSYFRLFCRVLCPLGAIYGLLNRISIYRLHKVESRCIGCGLCAQACPMAINPALQPDSAECIMCGKCVEHCPQQALHWGRKAEERCEG